MAASWTVFVRVTPVSAGDIRVKPDRDEFRFGKARIRAPGKSRQSPAEALSCAKGEECDWHWAKRASPSVHPRGDFLENQCMGICRWL